jgi:hypothetical protein
VNLLQSPFRAKKHRRVKPRELIALVRPLIVAIGFVALVVVTGRKLPFTPNGCGSANLRHQLPRIHDAERVERLLDGANGVDPAW